MTRRGRSRALIAAATAAILLAGCAPEETPGPTTSAEPTSESAPETTTPPEEDPRAALEADGFAAVERYIGTYYTLANGSFEDEGLIAQFLDSLGPNLREGMRRTIETAQAQNWSISGSPDVALLEMTDFTEAADYSSFVLRVCEDRTATVPYVDGVEQGEDIREVMEYTVSVATSSGTARVDGVANTGESCD